MACEVNNDNHPNMSENCRGELFESSQVEAAAIQAIDRGSVHRICSGQVVLTLATAVKELLENSIDAGATTVDIKLKDNGSESIEVTDNGSGVEERNFAGLTKKHHTSKLSDFEDLVNVSTFGFRGEALSSLCALSQMTVTTRHKSAAVGTKIEFDTDGNIACKTPTPRQQGTTVLLLNLFHTLPVRHKEFQRNLKKEFSKMVQVLNAYCLVNTGVRITCSNQTTKGSRSVVVSTNGNSTVKENIANIFGPKQLQSLLPFEQLSPTEEVCMDFGIQSPAGHIGLFRMEGFVSKCEHGQGRSSLDRQFIFINKRPCDSAKIAKVVNEVYHSYNRHQYPFIVLLITMDKQSVDVNVTPDKRQIFMEGEKLLLATIKTSLVKMFEPTTSILRVNQAPQLPGSLKSSFDSPSSGMNSPVVPASFSSTPDQLKASSNGVKEGALSSLARLKRSFSSAFDKSDHSVSLPDKQHKKLDTFLTKRHSSPARFSPEKGSIKQFFSSSSSLPPALQTPTSSESVSGEGSDDVVIVEPTPADSLGVSVDKNGVATDCVDNLPGVADRDEAASTEHQSPVTIVFHDASTAAVDCEKLTCAEKNAVKEDSVAGASCLLTPSHFPSCEQSPPKEVHHRSSLRNHEDSVLDKVITEGGDTAVVMGDCVETTVKEAHLLKQPLQVSCNGDGLHEDQTSEGSMNVSHSVEECGSFQSASLPVTFMELDQQESQPRHTSELSFSFQKLKECLTSSELDSTSGEKRDFARTFRAKICPADNSSAEEELQREISKDMFGKMDVLGQFNLGFIIAKNENDLFIVDQHATDEKYNFEMLQRHTVLQSQQLIHPQSLELTASNEVILMDNLDIFRKNGFDFVIDETAPPTQRVKLKSTPVSKNWSFGKDDIEELIFMLTDSPGVMCRPSRVRMMFASRACRKSIMIGTYLNKSEMKKLLCHMGEIEQPWNCPHGRPTMRHLINLSMLPK